MKTTISIPDSVFQTADRLAQRMGISRSEFYSRAVEDYIEAHRYDRVRESLDTVYDAGPSGVDEVMAEMQFRSLPKEDW